MKTECVVVHADDFPSLEQAIVEAERRLRLKQPIRNLTVTDYQSRARTSYDWYLWVSYDEE